jgi:hypothetical protein
VQFHEGIVGGQCLELVVGRAEGELGEASDALRALDRIVGVGIEAGPDRGTPECEFVQVGQGSADRRQAVIELGHPTGKLLPEGHRGGILQMRASRLYDTGEFPALVGEAITQALDARDEMMLGLLRCGDVHRRGKGVVRRLATVDVVIGMDRRLCPQLATGHLDRSVGNDLVAVHVCLSAAPGLPDEEREVVVELSVDHLVRRLRDQLDLLGGQHPQLAVGHGGGLLEDSQRPDHGTGEMVAADAEVMQGALCLGAPIAICRDLDFAHAVGFGAGRGGRFFAHGGGRLAQPAWPKNASQGAFRYPARGCMSARTARGCRRSTAS